MLCKHQRRCQRFDVFTRAGASCITPSSRNIRQNRLLLRVVIRTCIYIHDIFRRIVEPPPDCPPPTEPAHSIHHLVPWRRGNCSYTRKKYQGTWYYARTSYNSTSHLVIAHEQAKRQPFCYSPGTLRYEQRACTNELQIHGGTKQRL